MSKNPNKNLISKAILNNQKVLAPVVYLAHDYNKSQGAITQGKNDTTYTNLGKISTIEAINGNLIILAKDNITNIGANLIAKDNLLLQTQTADINLNAIKLENGHNVYFKGGFDKAKDVKYQTSNVKANNIVLNSGNNINLEASKLNANNQINLNAINDVNVTAVNDIHYTDVQTSKKGTFSKKTQRDMSYKEDVVSSELNAKDIYITSGNNINLEAVNINAKNEKIAHAQNSLNILAKIYKEGELHHTSKSSFGGMIKNEYKYEKDNLKIKSSEITANNVILDAKTINLEASKLKANQIEITTDILNMISSKESLYENEFSNKGGILTATIENKGKIEEIVIPSTIEVNDKLIFNKKDITSQLESDNLVKILSSQGNLTDEQINLIKQIANSKEWHDKTTTLSGVGALIITVIVIYFTAGAGAGIAGTLSGATAAGASVTATQTATQAAIQAVIQTVATQASVQLAGSVITGNKVDLDLDSIAKSAVTAGVLSYANGLVNGIDNLDKVTKTVANTTIQSGVQSVVFKTDFKDSLVSNLAMAGSDLLAKETFYEVGNTSMEKSVVYENELYKDGGLVKTLLHSATGAGIAAINNEDILAGALSAGVRELISPLSENYSKEGQLLASQLTGILVGGIVDGEAGAKSGMNIATAGELYNRQLHQDEIKFINENAQKFANEKGISLQDAKSRLAQQGLRGVDKAWSLILGEQTDTQAQDFITKNSNGLFIVKNEYEFKDGTINGQNEISNLNQNDYKQLKIFYQDNVYKITSTNEYGSTMPLGEAYKQDVGKELDGISWDTTNQAIRDFFPNAIEGIQNTPETINSAGNYLENVFPTTTQNRMDELYNQGSEGSKTQANLATMDFIGTASMVTGAGAITKSVVGGVTEGVVKSVDNSLNIDMKTISINGNQVELTNVGSKGNWDKLINKDLKPDTAYQLDNGHTYITNAQGKVNYVEADLNKITMDRNNYQQSTTGKSGNIGDQGGHLIASSLGGAGDRINLVPMDKVLNNGTWKKMESDLAKALEQGKDVSVKIDVGYPDGGGVRPNSFTVNYTIDGVIKKLPPFKQ